MNRSQARVAIRASTDHDDDTQVTDAQLDVWLEQEHKAFRRQLAMVAPTLYATTDDEQELESDDELLTKPVNFEQLIRIEKKYGTEWYPVEASDDLSPHIGGLTFREEGDFFKLAPAALVAGTYRIVHSFAPDDLDDDSDTLEVPPGCEDIILERVCARVRERLDSDPTPHLQRAKRLWDEQRPIIRRRHGKHAKPGLRLVRRW